MGFVAQSWKILVGIKDGLVLIFMLLFFGMLFAALASSPNPGANKDGALLLSLNGSLVEQGTEPDPRAFLSGSAPVNEYRLRDVVHVLEAAAKDDDVKLVVLDLDGFLGGGQAALTRVGKALDTVKAAKKPILAYATGYGDDSYQLAAHATEIWMDPMGGALFSGPGGTQLYFKGLIDRLGINARIYRVGKFKSFVEPFTLTKASPEAKAADQALVDALWTTYQADIAKARPKAQIALIAADPAGQVAANGNNLAKTGVATGLVDTLGDWTAFSRRVAVLTGEKANDRDAPDDFDHSTFENYLAANPRSTSGERVGIVTVAGEIVDGEADLGTAGGETVARLILDAIADDKLKALVLRVESPGGSAFASEKIRLAVLEAKKKKLPVVISMGNVAASGGYWVAMTGDKIFAEPATITGSIGVFGIIPTFENAIPKAGISADGVGTTPLSGQPDILRGTNAATDMLIQTGVEDAYRRFLSLVSRYRKMPVEQVNEIAQGRVWVGGDARRLGLVDAFGSLDDAVAEAGKLAKLDADDIEAYYVEPDPSFLATVFAPQRAQAARRDVFTMRATRERAMLATGVADAVRMLDTSTVQARCLACGPPTPRANWRSAFDSFFARIFA